MSILWIFLCSVHARQFNLSGMWVLVILFFNEKDLRLATIASLLSMYSTGASLSAQIMTPVWHAVVGTDVRVFSGEGQRQGNP